MEQLIRAATGWLLVIDPGNPGNLFLWLLPLNRAYIPQVFLVCQGVLPCLTQRRSGAENVAGGNAANRGSSGSGSGAFHKAYQFVEYDNNPK
ncbi:hypothetical protein [Desulfovibrio sp. QI0442]